MNAAFLLVTTAWFAGDTTAAMPVGACCRATSTCSTCSTCETGGHHLLDKLRAKFQKGNSCDTCATCAAPKCAPAPVCAPKCAPVCAPAPCDTCSSGPKLLERLKAHFHKEKCGCDTGCATGTAVRVARVVRPRQWLPALASRFPLRPRRCRAPVANRPPRKFAITPCRQKLPLPPPSKFPRAPLPPRCQASIPKIFAVLSKNEDRFALRSAPAAQTRAAGSFLLTFSRSIPSCHIAAQWCDRWPPGPGAASMQAGEPSRFPAGSLSGWQPVNLPRPNLAR